MDQTYSPLAHPEELTRCINELVVSDQRQYIHENLSHDSDEESWRSGTISPLTPRAPPSTPVDMPATPEYEVASTPSISGDQSADLPALGEAIDVENEKDGGHDAQHEAEKKSEKNKKKRKNRSKNGKKIPNGFEGE